MEGRRYAGIPLNYRLDFSFGWDPEDFSGRARITIDISKPTGVIEFDADMIEVTDISVKCKGRKMRVTGFSYPESDRLAVKLSNKAHGRCEFDIIYTGKVRSDMNGLFKQRYVEGGMGSYIIATQLESVFARSVFPCFDDPALKATFEVSVIAPKSMVALSNMPSKSSKALGDMRRTEFRRSPRMSTYLLFVGMGNFGSKVSALGKVKVRGFARREKAYMIGNSIKVAAGILRFFDNYLGIPYPLPKVDFIAVPGFNAAMENWGAIVSGERDVLYDEKKASIFQLQNISDTLAHELAHQWFGNLVTTSSWDDLWLNESFADLMSHKALDSLFPEWNIRTQYAIELFNGGAHADSLKNTHPISAAKTGLKPEDMFDTISYNKGYLVLRMIEHYMGSDAFLRGLRSYLHRNAYSNATPGDLIAALAAEAGKGGKELKAIAKSWLTIGGMPRITSKLSGGMAHLSKSRFAISGKRSAQNQEWIVPVSYIDSEGIDGIHLLKKKTDFRISGRWAIFNHMHSGFYRVEYDSAQLENIGMEISRGGLEALDAFGVENDFYALAKAGYADIVDYVNFVLKYCMDADPYTARDIAVNFMDMCAVAGEALPKQVASTAARFAKGVLEAQKSKPPSTPGKMLTSSALELLGLLGDTEALEWDARMARLAIKGKSIVPDLRATAYSIAARNGILGFNDLKRLYELADTAAERAEVVYAMGLIHDRAELHRALDHLAGKGLFYDEQLAAKAAFSSVRNTRAALEWLIANWDRLFKKFAVDSAALQFTIGYIRYISSRSDLDRFIGFFGEKAKENRSNKFAIENVIDLALSNIKFLSRMQKGFK